VVAAAAIACAAPGGSVDRSNDRSSRERTPDLEGAPVWVTRGCRAHWEDEAVRRAVVCGVGSAPAHRDRVAARETAVARARSAIARSVEVTIESVVRLEDGGAAGDEGRLASIVHQLSSASLPGCELVSVWQSRTGEIHALVSLPVARVQQSLRETDSLPRDAREAIARQAAEAFAASAGTDENDAEGDQRDRD
jgi:hypothetical protein